MRKKLLCCLLIILNLVVYICYESSNAENYGELPLVSWIEYWFDPDASTSLRMMIEKYKNRIVVSDELVKSIEKVNHCYECANDLSIIVDEVLFTSNYVGIGIRCIAGSGHKVLPYDAIYPGHIYYPSFSDISDGTYYFVQIVSRIESNGCTLFCFDRGDYGIDASLTTYYWQDLYETDHCWAAADGPWSDNLTEIPFPQECSIIVCIQVFELSDVLEPRLLESFEIPIDLHHR